MTSITVSALETQTPYVIVDSLFFLFSFCFFLIHFFTEICSCFSFLETGAIRLKLWHSLQNDGRGRLFYCHIWPKVTKLQLFEITLNTAAKQSAHCCCMQLVGHCMPWTSWHLGRIKLWRHVACPALLSDRRLKHRQSFCSSKTLECNPLLNKTWFRLSYN